MMRTTWMLVLLCSAVSGWVGFQLGSAGSDKALAEQDVASAPTKLQPNPSDDGMQVNPTAPTPADVAQHQALPAQKDEVGYQEQTVDAPNREPELPVAAEQAAERNAYREHIDQRQAFNRAFSEQQQDVDREVAVSDFFYLHDKAHQIELHKVMCATDKCQILGTFEGGHDAWETIMEDLQGTDWWDYTGTSSSSNTHDGVTHFNVFFDRR